MEKVFLNYALTNHDINHVLQDVHAFRGVGAYDHLPHLDTGQFCIVNTDNVHSSTTSPPEGGHHWITIYRDGRYIIIFDSFGRSLHDIGVDYDEADFHRSIAIRFPPNKYDLITTTQSIQHSKSSVCGWYCILVGLHLLTFGVTQTLLFFKEMFGTNLRHNDEILFHIIKCMLRTGVFGRDVRRNVKSLTDLMNHRIRK